MTTYRLVCARVVPSMGICVIALLVSGAATFAQSQVAPEAGVQVLTRGPIHEAFAMSSMEGAAAGVVIAKAPYDPIAELPPDQRPEGANVAWIPGYWGWDDDRSDYIWVSGVWRDIPPGRQWVPGYWAPVQNGVQWISGFWGEVAQTEVTYLPQPPEPLEVGPSSPAPGSDSIWAPGCWVWQQSRYYWQPGYWVVQRPDWVWTPAQYTWTPRGYVHVPAYWDYDMMHRGVMFAPVYYDQPVYRRSGYYHSPSTIIDMAAILTSLFVHRRSHHYYYGDYYDRRYEDRGFSPWYSRQSTHYGGDPLYAHYRSRQLLQYPNWDNHVMEQYRYRREHVEARPPQTLALQVNIINNQRPGAPENFLIGRSYSEMIQSGTQPLRFTPVNMDERNQIQTRGREVHRLQSERARMETSAAGEGKPRRSPKIEQPVRMQLPASPVAAKPLDKVEKRYAPPPVPDAPAPVAAEVKGKRARPQAIETISAPGQPLERRGKPAVQSSPTTKRPRRVEPEAVRPISPRKAAPEVKSEASGRRTGRIKTESTSPAPQTIRTRKSQGAEAVPEVKANTPQGPSRRKSVEQQRNRSVNQEQVESQGQSQEPVRKTSIRTPKRGSNTEVNKSRGSKIR